MPRMLQGTEAAPLEGRAGIVVSRYNENITERLLEGALRTLRDAGVADDAIDVARVPGAWEIPLVARELARSGSYGALVCLGAVIRGETTHDEHINRQVSLSLGQIALDFGLPVAFGVLTCNTLEQALQRAGGNVGNKGEEAAAAALEMARLLASIRATAPRRDEPSRGATTASERVLYAPSYASYGRRPRDSQDEDDDEGAADGPLREPRPLFSFPVPPPSPDSAVNPPATITTSGGEIAGGGRAPAKKQPRPRRRRAREVVLQMLYADDLHPGRNMADAESFVRHRLNFDAKLVAFGLGLLAGVRKNRPALDAILSKQATNWSLARMAATDRNVLRLGAYEILYTDTPRVVVINEAVDLARRYGSRQSAPFVNGILDRLQTERRGAPTE